VRHSLPPLCVLLVALPLATFARESARSGDDPPPPRTAPDDAPAGERRREGRQGEGRGEGRGDRMGGDRKGGDREGRGGGSRLGNYTTPPPANNVPDHPHTVILGRPTDDGVTIRVRLRDAGEAHVEHGAIPDAMAERTDTIRFAAGETHDFVLDGLAPNARHHYALRYRTVGGDETVVPAGTFHTRRAAGSPFVFTVTSDSHLDENTSGAVYLRTLANAAADQPDFHFELGDTFMTGKYARPEIAEAQYLAQRYYLGSLCHSAALFLALGNHDGEGGGRRSTEWATATRTRLFPNPFPDGFYTGNDRAEPVVGLPQNYYQWSWGDAQCIVLDPFRATTGRSRDGDGWAFTLGEEQYRWLRESLSSVDARYRFVFLHHLVGGTPPHSRGGVEAAPYWEWGGKGASGEDAFAERRPGWEAPIHDLLVRHGVSVVFHGHDHLFAKQDLDGIVYQLVPQPGHRRAGNTSSAAEYGYLAGEIQPSSGHLRVRVGADETRVDYVRAFLREDRREDGDGGAGVNGSVSYSYVVAPTPAADRGSAPAARSGTP